MSGGERRSGWVGVLWNLCAPGAGLVYLGHPAAWAIVAVDLGLLTAAALWNLEVLWGHGALAVVTAGVGVVSGASSRA